MISPHIMVTLNTTAAQATIMNLFNVFTDFGHVSLGMFSFPDRLREGQMCFFFSSVSLARRYMISCWCCVDSLTTWGGGRNTGDIR